MYRHKQARLGLWQPQVRSADRGRAPRRTPTADASRRGLHSVTRIQTPMPMLTVMPSRARCRRLDRAGGRGGRQRNGRRFRDEARRNAEHGEDEDEDEDADDGQDPVARQSILPRRQRASVAGLVASGIGARCLARHASGPSPGFGSVMRAASWARVALASAALDRRRDSASTTSRRRSATRRRALRVSRTALKPRVQARRASEPMTSSASAATARSRISPTAREG